MEKKTKAKTNCKLFFTYQRKPKIEKN